MNENCYLLLGLEFDPPVTDDAVIDTKIAERKKYWISQKNSMDGPLYVVYSEEKTLNEIRKIMHDPKLRSDHADNAKAMVNTVIDTKIKTYGRNGELSDEALSAIAKSVTKEVAKTNPTYKVTKEYVKKRADKKGVKIIAPKAKVNYREIYDKYYKNGPKGSQGNKALSDHLRVIGKSNLYEFLGVKLDAGETCKESFNVLNQIAQQKKDSYRKLSETRHDAEVSAGLKLCEACGIAFKDAQAKDDYDAYLLWLKRRQILEEVGEFAVVDGGSVSKTVADKCIKDLSAQLKDKKLAEDVLAAYCDQTKGISFSGSDSAQSPPVKICRKCGRMNDSSKDICESCGTDLTIKCPKCGTVIDSSANFCGKCHFDARQIDLALLRYEQAEDSVRCLDYKSSDELLKEAKSLWDNKNKVSQVQKLREDSKKIYGSLPEDLKKAVSEKEFFKAKKLYEELQKKVSGYKDTELESKINAAVSESESYFKKAQSLSNEVDILDICSKAVDVCLDNPDILKLVGRYPPKPPANLSVVSDGIRKMNMLSWDKSPSDGLVYYSVVRKEGSVPSNNSDGLKIGRVSMCSINDSDIKPGVFYYYAVFTERSGAVSSPLTNLDKPAVSLFEIEGVTVIPGDKKLQITWKTVPSGCTVELFRSSENEKETKLSVSNQTGFQDAGLVNDKQYTYRIQLVYAVGGKTESTKGVTVSAQPTSPPAAIDSLTVKHVKDDLFKISWDNPENLPLKFFCSEKKPSFDLGEVVTTASLESQMRELNVSISGGETASFRYNGSGVIYITAVSEKSCAVTIGRIVRAGKGESISIKSVSDVNGKLTINLTPPNNTTGFVVLYRFDQFPSDISDAKAKRKYLPIAHYTRNGALILETPEQKDYFISVFAEFRRDGESDYSSSADYLFRHASKETITYSVSVSKKLIGGSTLHIEFESENSSFELPDIDIYTSAGRIPMFKNSGALLHSIQAQTVKGKYQLDIPLPKNLDKNSYLKPFLHNDNMHDNYELKMKLNTNPKIT